MNQETPARFPLWEMAFGNASLLSALYLLAAIVIELARRFLRWEWAHRASVALLHLPERTLDLLGLMGPMRNWYLDGSEADSGYREIVVRLGLGATTIAIIFATALLVAALTWGMQRAASRPE